MKQHTYIIGDVHGYYDTLLALVAKLPKKVELIFVGDLIDRGAKSAEVVRYVWENGHRCTMGNHEELMCSLGDSIIKAYEEDLPLEIPDLWHRNGGIETLFSYQIISLSDDLPMKVTDYKQALKRFKEDIAWLRPTA